MWHILALTQANYNIKKRGEVKSSATGESDKVVPAKKILRRICEVRSKIRSQLPDMFKFNPSFSQSNTQIGRMVDDMVKLSNAYIELSEYGLGMHAKNIKTVLTPKLLSIKNVSGFFSR
tara:strand:- start:120 stop:476 length:357 start_codon:yes stop_codon:yes gene_type:complete